MLIRKRCAKIIIRWRAFRVYLCLIIKEINLNLLLQNLLFLDTFISYTIQLFHDYNKQKLKFVKCKFRNIFHKMNKINKTENATHVKRGR